MNRLFDAIIGNSIRHHRLVFGAALALLITGIWSGNKARFDALPNFTPARVVVQAEAPGLGSRAVEERITTPLEQMLLGVPDLQRIRSTSAAGLAVIDLTFTEGSNIFQARQLVSERLVRARERLPASLPAPRIAPITAPVGALLKWTYTAQDRSGLPLSTLWRMAQWQVRPRLQALSGVARVTVHGGATARIEVRPDPTALLARHVTPEDLEQALRRGQGLAPLGHSNVGSQRQPLRANGLWTFDRLDTIAHTVVRARKGEIVRISDVARVVAGEAPAVGTALYDGQPAIYLQVDKLPWADTLRVTTAVEKTLQELDAVLPPGAVRQPPVFRQADFVRTSLGAVGKAMGIGVLLVIIVLIVFLRSLRLAAISLIALPLSIITAATILLLLGVTINGMILGGLAIAVGEVVDDAIVDGENVWRRLTENARRKRPQAPFEVIRKASTEVRSSVVHASLIVIAVLTPILFLGGLAGRIFAPLAASYALAVAASLLVALTVTPALCAALLPPRATTRSPETRFARVLVERYGSALQGLARHPAPFVVFAALLGAAAVVALPGLSGGFLPEFQEGVLITEVAAWPGTSLEEATRMARRIEAELRTATGVNHVAVRVGRASLDEDAAPVHRMEMDLVLRPDGGDPELTIADVVSRLAHIPGVRCSVDGFLGERINELLSGERAPIAVQLQGDDLQALRGAARTLLQRIVPLTGVEGAQSRSLVDVPTTDLSIDGVRCAVAGVGRGDVVTAVAAWRQGIEVTRVKRTGGFSVPVVIAGDPTYHSDDRLRDLPIFSSAALPWPLSTLARLTRGAEPSAIRHEGGQRIVSITARARKGRLADVATRIEHEVADAALPPATSWKMTGQAAERKKAVKRLVLTTALVLVVIFAFLCMAFGNALDGAVVLAGLPLGLVGGVIAAWMLPEGVSMAGLVGFVALSGIISRNGIMLVTHKNRLLRERPLDNPEEIIVAAAKRRLLPILMTAATAFFGLLPLAASLETAGSELEAPMALIVCGGLLTSTALNLFAVPAFYMWRAQWQKSGEATA